MKPFCGAIEAGGTKWVCGVGTGPEDLRGVFEYPTTTPEETIGRAIEFFQGHHKKRPLTALGVGCFGPLDLNPKSPTFGFIRTTPKPGWANSDVVGPLRSALGVPVAIDTDTNAAALGERLWGASRGLDDSVYLTIGTGIGGGIVANGQLIHGLVHPEVGHMRIPHDWKTDPYPGRCPYHGDCLEGLACGPAIEDRWGVPARQLGADHEAWSLEAGYLAAAVSGLVCVLSPRRVILGGGVMKQKQLFPLIREGVRKSLNGYVQAREILKEIDQFIVSPGLGDRAGLCGALALAVRVAG